MVYIVNDKYLYIDDKEVLNDLRTYASGQGKSVAICLREAVRFYIYSGSVQAFLTSGVCSSGSWILVCK